MGIADKIANAKNSNWVTEGLTESEVKTTVELAKISARIERYRVERGMSQQDFAVFMGVSQAMISKWESRDYNFTIKTLNEICQKIGVKLSVTMENSTEVGDYKVIKWDKEGTARDCKRPKWLKEFSDKEAIA